MKHTLILFTFLLSFNAYAIECKRDPKLTFLPEGTVSLGNVKITNRFRDGECNLVIMVDKGTKKNHRVSEQYTISDMGKLLVFTSSPESFSSSTNSRATGSRTYYLLPRKKDNVSYEYDPKTDRINFKMANGETLSLSSRTGEIVDISNTKWKRDRALRNYVKNGKVVAQDVYSNKCHNCGLKYKGVKYDKFDYVEGGLEIESTKNGVVLDTGTLRGGDSRLPSLWGNQKDTLIRDKNGIICDIQNRFIYEYVYEELPGRDGKIHRSIDGINIKFKDDATKFPTRKGMSETVHEFLKRVCVQKRGLKNFDLSSFEAVPSDKADCESCKVVPGSEELKRVSDIGELFDKIKTELPKKRAAPKEEDFPIQVGAFGVFQNAFNMKTKAESEGHGKCHLFNSPVQGQKRLYRVKCSQ